MIRLQATRLQAAPSQATSAAAAAPARLTPLVRRTSPTDQLTVDKSAAASTLPPVATRLRPMPANTRNALEVGVRGGMRISTGNRVSLHVDGDQAFPALVDLIRNAKSSLYIETMIWHNDETGQAVARELAAAKRRGVDVKVLVDSVGQRFGEGRNHDPRILSWLRQQGIEAYTFNPTIISRDGAAITHHKLYIADNERFLSGGMNIGNEYARDWHDMLFLCEGPATVEAAKEFAANWQKRTGQVLCIPEPAAPPAADRPLPGTAAVGIAVTDPNNDRRELKQVTLSMIRNARHSIRVQLPYNSDDEFMDALKDAARRGVNVEFIMPGANNDALAFTYLNANEAQRLIEAGVKVRFYGDPGTPQAGRFSHLKMIIIDDKVAAVGSGNGDYRTFNNNNELNAYVADPAFVGALRRDVWDRDWADSAPATLESLQGRPLWQRLAGSFFEAVDRLL